MVPAPAFCCGRGSGGKLSASDRVVRAVGYTAFGGAPDCSKVLPDGKNQTLIRLRFASGPSPTAPSALGKARARPAGRAGASSAPTGHLPQRGRHGAASTAAGLPSSVACGDSFPTRGKPWRGLRAAQGPHPPLRGTFPRGEGKGAAGRPYGNVSMKCCARHGFHGEKHAYGFNQI